MFGLKWRKGCFERSKHLTRSFTSEESIQMRANDVICNIGMDEVAVWKIDVHKISRSRQLFAVLSSDERERGGRFVRSEDRFRYLAVRATVRLRLARYLGKDPDKLQFAYNDWGKPYLAGEDDWLRFNVSKSNEVAMLAVSRVQSVGIDVQKHHDLDALELARTCFAKEEITALSRQKGSDLKAAFFDVWARKEAFIKADGRGLSYPLNMFEVTVGCCERPRIVQVNGSKNEASQWTLKCVETSPGFSSALVREGGEFSLRILDSEERWH